MDAAQLSNADADAAEKEAIIASLFDDPDGTDAEAAHQELSFEDVDIVKFGTPDKTMTVNHILAPDSAEEVHVYTFTVAQLIFSL